MNVLVEKSISYSCVGCKYRNRLGPFTKVEYICNLTLESLIYDHIEIFNKAGHKVAVYFPIPDFCPESKDKIEGLPNFRIAKEAYTSCDDCPNFNGRFCEIKRKVVKRSKNPIRINGLFFYHLIPDWCPISERNKGYD